MSMLGERQEVYEEQGDDGPSLQDVKQALRENFRATGVIDDVTVRDKTTTVHRSTLLYWEGSIYTKGRPNESRISPRFFQNVNVAGNWTPRRIAGSGCNSQSHGHRRGRPRVAGTTHT